MKSHCSSLLVALIFALFNFPFASDASANEKTSDKFNQESSLKDASEKNLDLALDATYSFQFLKSIPDTAHAPNTQLEKRTKRKRPEESWHPDYFLPIWEDRSPPLAPLPERLTRADFDYINAKAWEWISNLHGWHSQQSVGIDIHSGRFALRLVFINTFEGMQPERITERYLRRPRWSREGEAPPWSIEVSRNRGDPPPRPPARRIHVREFVSGRIQSLVEDEDPSPNYAGGQLQLNEGGFGFGYVLTHDNDMLEPGSEQRVRPIQSPPNLRELFRNAETAR